MQVETRELSLVKYRCSGRVKLITRTAMVMSAHLEPLASIVFHTYHQTQTDRTRRYHTVRCSLHDPNIMLTLLVPYFKTHGWSPSPLPHHLPDLPTQRHANPRAMVAIGLCSPPASRFLHWNAFALPHLHLIPTHPSRSSNPTGAYV